jgi:hypothetical protein
MASFYVDPAIVAVGEREELVMAGLDKGEICLLNSPGFIPKLF